MKWAWARGILSKMATGNYKAEHSLAISPLCTRPLSQPAMAEYFWVVNITYIGKFKSLTYYSILAAISYSGKETTNT